MTIGIKDLGLLNTYNEVDICQSKYYVKLSNATYIDKLINEHDWLLNDDKLPTYHYHPRIISLSTNVWKK